MPHNSDCKIANWYIEFEYHHSILQKKNSDYLWTRVSCHVQLTALTSSEFELDENIISIDSEFQEVNIFLVNASWIFIRFWLCAP